MHEAKTHLSRLVKRAVNGEEIVLAVAGKPQVRLVPVDSPKFERKLGTMKGQIWIADNFDDPMPEFEKDFYGE